MSTKVYNAYRTPRSIHSVLSHFDKIKKYLLIEATYKVRGAIDILPTEYTKSDQELYKLLLDDVHSYTYSKYEFDFNSSALVYFPTRRTQPKYKKDIFVRIFHNKYASASGKMHVVDLELKSKDKFYDYHYQNSTDPPEHISEKDFEARGRYWDSVIKDSTSQSGLLYEFISATDLRRIARHALSDKSISEYADQWYW